MYSLHRYTPHILFIVKSCVRRPVFEIKPYINSKNLLRTIVQKLIRLIFSHFMLLLLHNITLLYLLIIPLKDDVNAFILISI